MIYIFQTTISFVWSIDFKYVNKYVYYLFQYPSKVVTETADAKIKIYVIKNDGKKIILVIADVNLVTKEFQKHEYWIRTIQGHQVNQIVLRQLHQWKISHQA